MNEKGQIFTEEETGILQEVMNIAFGKATASLTDVIDVYVALSVPQIQVLNLGDIPDCLRETVESGKRASVVEQKFWGDFEGAGFLVFNDGAERGLMEILSDGTTESFESSKEDSPLAKEILMDIGNILIGACIGKLTELLETIVTYSQPAVIIQNSKEYEAFIKSLKPTQTAILLQTVFKFDKKNISGMLLILTSEEALTWLRKSLDKFVENYG